MSNYYLISQLLCPSWEFFFFSFLSPLPAANCPLSLCKAIAWLKPDRNTFLLPGEKYFFFCENMKNKTKLVQTMKYIKMENAAIIVLQSGCVDTLCSQAYDKIGYLKEFLTRRREKPRLTELKRILRGTLSYPHEATELEFQWVTTITSSNWHMSIVDHSCFYENCSFPRKRNSS